MYPSTLGSPAYNYFALIVAIRDLAMENGCTVLATARLSEISEALTRAIKRREESSNDER